MNTAYLYFGIALFAIAIIALLVWILIRTKPQEKKEEETNDKAFSLLLQQMESLRESLERKLTETNTQMHQSVQAQLSSSQKLIQEITKQVADQLIEVNKGMSETKETNKQVFTLAQQLGDLEKVLKNQKTRGNLGEMGLELILSNILPPTAYQMQYSFKNGETVDAVIFTNEGKFIPVDAKFSLDNYRRLLDEEDETRKEELAKLFRTDLKKRIDETAKYIRPSEGTLPFAFMFIPAEGIYYDLLVNEVGTTKANTRNLIDYAHHEKKVIIVSPTTFSAYLQSVLYGFKAFQIEKQAVEIKKNVEKLGRHLKSYEEAFTKLGNTLGTAANHYNKASHQLRQVDKDILRITGESPQIETLKIDGPEKEA